MQNLGGVVLIAFRNSFSQRFVLSQYSRILRKILTENGLCKIKRILSIRGHRNRASLDEKRTVHGCDPRQAAQS